MQKTGHWAQADQSATTKFKTAWEWLSWSSWLWWLQWSAFLCSSCQPHLPQRHIWWASGDPGFSMLPIVEEKDAKCDHGKPWWGWGRGWWEDDDGGDDDYIEGSLAWFENRRAHLWQSTAYWILRGHDCSCAHLCTICISIASRPNVRWLVFFLSRFLFFGGRVTTWDSPWKRISAIFNGFIIFLIVSITVMIFFLTFLLQLWEQMIFLLPGLTGQKTRPGYEC